jgi:DNA-binding CsgD family transcriptional regulator
LVDQFPADVIEDLLDDVYFAAADAQGWQAVVNRLATICDGAAISLQGHDFAANRHLGVLTAGFAPEAVTSFRDHFASVNPWAPGMARWPVGTTMLTESIIAREDLVKTEFYNGFLRPNDDISLGVGVIAFRNQLRFFALAANIRTKDESRLQPRVISLFDTLGPHVRRAFRVSRALGDADVAKQGTEAFETIAAPVFLLSGLGRVVYANAAARDPDGAGASYVQYRSGDLRFLDDRANKRLAAAIGTGAGQAASATTFQALSSDGKAVAVVTVAPFSAASGRSAAFLDFASSRQPATVLFLETPAMLRERKQLQLIQFNLSEAECFIVLGLCEGSSVEELASRRGTSINTVRNQVQAAFSKLGVRRQAELVARVSQLT